MPTTPFGRWTFDLLRTAVDVTLALHFAAAAFWWWFSPKGCPLDHCQVWTNSVVPLAAMAVAFIGVFAMHRGNRSVAAATVLTFASAWAAAAIAGRVIFPVSLAGIWWLFLLVAIAGAAIFALLLLRGDRRVTPALGICGAFGIIVGVSVVWLQIPRPASTFPIDLPFPEIAGDKQSNALAAVRFGANGIFHPAEGTVTLKRGNVAIHCSPLLDFNRISPDGFWSLLAPRASGTARHCVNHSINEASQAVQFSDGSTVVLPRAAPDGSVEVNAYTPLVCDVFPT